MTSTPLTTTTENFQLGDFVRLARTAPMGGYRHAEAYDSGQHTEGIVIEVLPREQYQIVTPYYHYRPGELTDGLFTFHGDDIEPHPPDTGVTKKDVLKRLIEVGYRTILEEKGILKTQ